MFISIFLAVPHSHPLTILSIMWGSMLLNSPKPITLPQPGNFAIVGLPSQKKTGLVASIRALNFFTPQMCFETCLSSLKIHKEWPYVV